MAASAWVAEPLLDGKKTPSYRRLVRKDAHEPPSDSPCVAPREKHLWSGTKVGCGRTCTALVVVRTQLCSVSL